MHLSVERFSRKNDVKLFAFKYMISMRLSGSLQLHRTSHMLERAALRSSLSSDWVRMCFEGIFGYILKCFGLMFRSSHAIPRPSVWSQSPRVDGGGSTPEPALPVWLVWLPVKTEFAFTWLSIVCPLQPVWRMRRGLLFCIFFSGDFSQLWHVHRVPGPMASAQEPWGAQWALSSQRVLHYHIQDAAVWSVPWAFVESSPGLFLLGEP